MPSLGDSYSGHTVGSALSYDTDQSPEERIELLYTHLGRKTPTGLVRAARGFAGAARTPEVKKLCGTLTLPGGRPATAGAAAGRRGKGGAAAAEAPKGDASGPGKGNPSSGAPGRVKWFPGVAEAGERGAAFSLTPAGGLGAARDRKKKKLDSARSLAGRYPANLSLVFSSILLEAKDQVGPHLRLTLDSFTKVALSLGCEDALLVAATFQILCQKAVENADNASTSLDDIAPPAPTPPIGPPASITHRDLFCLLDRMVNGYPSAAFTEKAFSLFSQLGGCLHYAKSAPTSGFDGAYFIHSETLQELKRLRSADLAAGRTCLMIKTLTALFAENRAKEDEAFLLAMAKGKSKKKPKKPASIAPLRLRDEMKDFHRSRHMSLGEFREHVSKSPELVRAFLPVAFQCTVQDPSLLDGEPAPE